MLRVFSHNSKHCTSYISIHKCKTQFKAINVIYNIYILKCTLIFVHQYFQLLSHQDLNSSVMFALLMIVFCDKMLGMCIRNTMSM